MTFSVGLLYSAQEFLAFIFAHRVQASDVRASFHEFGLVKLTDVLNVVQLAGWAGVDVEGRVAITELGLNVVNAPNEIDRLRIQLGNLLSTQRPPWLRLFPRGREEAIPYLPQPVQQCLREAGLVDSESSSVIAWWDKFSDIARSDEQSALTKIGREGEARSLAFEKARTGLRPDWKSLYSNNAGYDLLSRISEDNSSPLCVEVKASKQRLEEARFFITVNEWDTAINAAHYVFHLWLLEQWTEPRVVDVNTMRSHIPTNVGFGAWKLAVVPFAALT